jgi:membrane protein implicated in regulation of membrane protease activity
VSPSSPSAPSPAAIGSGRLIDRPAVVIEAISPDDDGMVRIDREEWRASTADDSSFQAGQHVRVVQVRGTRVVVTLDRSKETSP